VYYNIIVILINQSYNNDLRFVESLRPKQTFYLFSPYHTQPGDGDRQFLKMLIDTPDSPHIILMTVVPRKAVNLTKKR
jgi:hypothetical protein